MANLNSDKNLSQTQQADEHESEEATEFSALVKVISNAWFFQALIY